MVNTQMWKTEYELCKIKGENGTHVITRQTFYNDNITNEYDEVFKDFKQAYNQFHFLLRKWL